MNLDQTTLISEVEYGSRFQGLHDIHSDSDRMGIVMLNKKDFVFGVKKEAAERNQNKYFTLPKFTSIILKGSYDSLIMLSSQFVQSKHDDLNYVLDLFSDKVVFDQYCDLNLKQLVLSQCGEFNKLTKGQNRFNELNGKQILKLHVNKTRALFFDQKQYLNDNVSLNNVIQMSSSTQHFDRKTQFFVNHKRENSFKQLSNAYKNEFDENLNEYLLECKTILDELYNKYKSHKIVEFQYEKEFKSRVVQFMINYYQ